MDYQEARAILDASKASELKQSIREQAERQQAISEQQERDAIWAKISDSNKAGYQFGDFKRNLIESFLTESLVVFTDNCLSQDLIVNEQCLSLVRQLVTNYVNENGYVSILAKMKRTSNLLSEMAYIVEQTVESVLEGVDKNNSATRRERRKSFKSISTPGSVPRGQPTKTISSERIAMTSTRKPPNETNSGTSLTRPRSDGWCIGIA